MMKKQVHISQIAFSTSNLKNTVNFYTKLFHLEDTGHVSSFRGPTAEYIQGIKGIGSTTHWLQDGRREFQLEFFQFEVPIHHKPKDWSPCDIGLTRIAFEVLDIEKTLEKARKLGASSITPPVLIDGRRHATFKDLDGVLVELIEKPYGLSNGRKAKVAGIALSVPDLDKAVQLYNEGFGLRQKTIKTEEIDNLLGLKGASRKAVLFDGRCCWIEISQYMDPEPKPWREGHLLTDIGLSHIAVSGSSFDEVEDVFNEVNEKKYMIPNGPDPMMMRNKEGICMYSKDQQGFTIETVYLHKKLWGFAGFNRPNIIQKFLMGIGDRQALKKYPQKMNL